MSYEPSHRKPPRQERWPNATPGEGWPAYTEGNGQRSWASADALAGSRNGYGDAWGGRTATAEYGYGDGRAPARYDEPASGYWAGGNGYGGTTTYPAVGDGYQEQDEYPALEPSTSSVLAAPDTLGEWWRRPEGGTDRNPGRGLAVGAVMGILAAAVAIGVATFAAAFVRPQASPASVVGNIFIDRIPAALKHSVMTHFGAHDRTVLLLGMYVAIGLIAMVLGCMARRNPSVGVAGIAAFGLLGAFIVVTRPESRASDVIPSAIGAVAGVMALLWLARASAPVTAAAASRRPAYSGGRRAR